MVFLMPYSVCDRIDKIVIEHKTDISTAIVLHAYRHCVSAPQQGCRPTTVALRMDFILNIIYEY